MKPILFFLLSSLACLSNANLSELNLPSLTELGEPEKPIFKSLKSFEEDLSENGKITFKFISEFKERVKRDPQVSFDKFFYIKDLYSSNSVEFVKILNVLIDDDLAIYVGSVLKCNKLDELKSVFNNFIWENLKRKERYVEKIQKIFKIFDEVIWKCLTEPPSGSTLEDKRTQLEDRKDLAFHFLTMLQAISYSSSLVISPYFSESVSTYSYYWIMMSFIQRIQVDPIVDAEIVNYQLHQRCVKLKGKLPKERAAKKRILTLLLLFRYCSCRIISHDYVNIEVGRLDPIFLARIAIARNSPGLDSLFRYFNNCLLISNGINSFHH
jgi:hypothetical protein